MSLEITFPFLLHDAARLWGKKFDHLGRDTALSRAQAKAIGYLRRNQGIHQRDLADLLEVEPITLARLLDRLEAAGLVERRPDPGDRRAHRLYVTEVGEQAFSRVRQVVDTIQALALQGFTPAEVDTLTALMERVHLNLSGRHGTCDHPECSVTNPDREQD